MDVKDIVFWDGKTDPKPNEVWVPAPGFESYYLVSSFGRILRITGGCGTKLHGKKCYLLNPRVPNSKGYLSVKLCGDGKRRSVKVHTIVVEAFLGGMPEDEYGRYEVHHIKPDEKTNNRLDNLEWKSAKENREEQWHRYYTRGEVVW